jgi:hypothetical protein
MLKIYYQKYERVKEFKCLGKTLAEHKDITTGIKERIIMVIETSYWF